MAETDPDELERRIALTRTELALTVDAIADRVNPKRVAERGVADLRDRAGRLMASVGDTLGVRPRQDADDPERLWDDDQPNPGPLLVGVGAVLVVGAAILLFRRRRKRG